MATSFFAALGIFVLNILTPGPSFVLTVSNSMTHGRCMGFFVALGLATADTFFATAATAGLAALVGQNILLLKSVSLLGGLWFIYGGLLLILKKKAKQPSQSANGAACALSALFGYRLGFTAGAFNAQAIIFFSSMFLAALSVTPSLSDSVALVAGVACVSAITRCGVVLVFTTRSVMHFYTKQRRRVEAVSGGALAAFGLKLALPAAAMLTGRMLEI